MVRYSAQELAAAAGVPRTALDYWARTRLLVPDADDTYGATEVSVGLVLAEAARLGAPGHALAALADRLRCPSWEWPDDLWMTGDGQVLDEDGAPAAWVLHPRRVLAKAGPAMMVALTAAA